MRLPFNANTFANTYQPEAFMSGIVFAKNEKHLPYFLSNYIRPVHYISALTKLNYYIDNPFLLNHGLIKRDYIAAPVTSLQVVDWASIARNALSNYKYVFGLFNDEDVPQKPCYNKRYFPHDYLLYGYDNDGFISAAYLNDKHFHEFKITYNDFNSAVRSLKQDQFIHLLEYDNSLSLGFMPNLVKEALNDYITSKNMTQDGTIYGINAFKYFAEELIHNRTRIDERAICFLREHKLLMKKRLEYMMEEKYIKYDIDTINKYDLNINQLQKAILLTIKYNIRNNSGILSQIHNIIINSIIQDESILPNIISQL